MERELLGLLLGVARSLDDATRRRPRESYSDLDVLAVLLWAALRDRSILWATDIRNWPLCDRRRRLPSPATMSRRLRGDAIHALLEGLIAALRVRGEGDRTLIIDGRPLRVARHSGDPEARFGRAAGGLDNGYKLHEIADLLGNCRAFCVRPMNEAEQSVARDLIARVAPGEADELLGDANYDSSDLYSLAEERGMMMVAQRRRKQAKGLGHRRQNPLRLRSIEAQTREPDLLARRRRIESCFGTQGNTPGGLGPLPNHVRRLRRVRLWVAAKLAIDAAHRHRRLTRRAA